VVLIELFSLGVTAEALRASIASKSAILLQGQPVDSKFQVPGVAPPTKHSSQKTRLNDLSYGIKIWMNFSSVLSQSTRLADRQTDGQTDTFLATRPPSIQCSAVINSTGKKSWCVRRSQMLQPSCSGSFWAVL